MRQAKIKCPCCGAQLLVRDVPPKAINLKPLWDAMDSVWKAMDKVFKDLR